MNLAAEEFIHPRGGSGMKTLKALIVVACMTALTGTARATLVDRGNGTVLDTGTGLVWLQDWNVNGAQSWDAQIAWANDLTFGGSSDWFLPGSGNYSDLYNEYGDLTAVPAFTDVQDYEYWTSTYIDSDTALFFEPSDGSVYVFGARSNPFYAVAVRFAVPADYGPLPVPEPPTLALLLAALGATVISRRRPSRRGDAEAT